MAPTPTAPPTVTHEPLPKSPLRGLRAAWMRLRGAKTARLHGLTLATDPDLVPHSVRLGVFKGGYEGAEALFVRRAVRAGDRVVEIGTGTGFVSLLAAAITGPERVFCYEANAALEPIIRANHRLNGMAPDLTLKGVTADGAPIVFHRNDNLISSSVYERDLQAEAIEIPSVALADVLAERRPDVLVMDIEGAEVDVLRGADLSGLRAAIIELHPHIVGADRIDALLDEMTAQGFDRHTRVQKNVLLERSG